MSKTMYVHSRKKNFDNLDFVEEMFKQNIFCGLETSKLQEKYFEKWFGYIKPKSVLFFIQS